MDRKKLTTSGVLMSGFFEGLPLEQNKGKLIFKFYVGGLPIFDAFYHFYPSTVEVLLNKLAKSKFFFFLKTFFLF